MSNYEQSQSFERRIIKIKPIELKKDEKQDEQLISGEDVASLHSQAEMIKAELAEINERKASLIETTKAEIKKEKNEWQQEKLAWIESAKKEGYSAGFELGKADVRKEYQEILNRANTIVETTTKDYHATLEKSEDMIVQLAVKVAEKIINLKITENSSLFLDLVKAAIKEIEDRSTISIYLHPLNYETVFEQKQELMNLLENEAKLSLYVKENLSENACIIEHPFGRVDASIDTQLSQIRNVLLELSGGE